MLCMPMRVTVVCPSVLCVFVCLSLCYHSSASASLLYVCDKLSLPAKSLLNSKGFQLAGFTKKLSLLSYSFFFI